MLIVVDKTGLPVSRRLGPFPRGNGSSWLVAGNHVLSTTQEKCFPWVELNSHVQLTREIAEIQKYRLDHFMGRSWSFHNSQPKPGL